MSDKSDNLLRDGEGEALLEKIQMESDARGADMDDGDLERIYDVSVQATVELGRRRIRIAEVLDIGPGTVIEFPKSADEPLDVRINGQLIARGEAVVVGERYGVRITEVVSPNERLHNSGIIKERAA